MNNFTVTELADDLKSGRPHIWIIPLEESAADTSGMARLLSGDEMERADRYQSGLDRLKFIQRRAVLRHLLGRYTRSEAARIRFHNSDGSKPRLEPADRRRGLDFNLSHSHRMMAVVVCLGQRVGIDIEHVRSVPDLRSMVVTVCSESERRLFERMGLRPDADREFLRLWTRKEALLKADGRGLGFPVTDLDLGVTLASQAPVHRYSHAGLSPHAWSLMDLRIAADYVGAAAIEGDHASPLWLYPQSAISLLIAGEFFVTGDAAEDP